MPIVLNFQKKDIPAIKRALNGLEELPATNKFEELRAKDGPNVVVVYSSGKTAIQGKEPEKTKQKLLEALGLAEELVLGFDETGRGENFGPMVVTGVLGDTNRLREIRDSKKTANIKEKFEKVSKNALAVASFSLNAEFIDRLRKKGRNLNEIEAAIIDKIFEAFKELGETPKTVVDGNPIKTKNREIKFLPKADDLEPVVGSASVAAKFFRDISKDDRKRDTWKNSKTD